MESADRGPEGLKGWLVLPGIGLVVTPFLLCYQLYTELSLLLDRDFREAVSDPGSPVYNPMWIPVIAIEAVLAAALLVGTLFVLRWFFTKSPRLPGAYIAWILSTIAIQVVDVVMVNQMNLPATIMSDQDLYKDLGRSIVQACIWVPYFLTSQRVKNTFVAASPTVPATQEATETALAQPPAAEP